MSIEEKTQWTADDFSDMSWDDNYVYALRIVEGDNGVGKLTLDIDYILEWIRNETGEISFRIAPATLTFYDEFNLKNFLDYETPTAGLVPFSIDRIERHAEKREHYMAVLWKIIVDWPTGEIRFEAKGFTQQLRGKPILTEEQFLKEEDRNASI